MNSTPMTPKTRHIPSMASAPPQSMAYPARKLPNMAPRPLEAIIIMDWPFTWSTGETFALA